MVESKLSINKRIEKELDLLSEAPDIIIDSFLKAYQAIIIDEVAQPSNINECDSEIAYQLGITKNNPEEQTISLFC